MFFFILSPYDFQRESLQNRITICFSFRLFTCESFVNLSINRNDILNDLYDNVSVSTNRLVCD